jgi:hypothetical protein
MRGRVLIREIDEVEKQFCGEIRLRMLVRIHIGF